MAYLKLNNWEVAIANAQAKTVRTQVGAQDRMLSTRLQRGERGWPREWTLATPPMTAAQAEALENLLLGRGHTFSFDSWGLTADGTGLGANAGYAAQLITSAPTPKYGARALKVNSSGGSCAWTVTLPDSTSWSMMWWHNHNNSPANTWTHYAVTCTAGSYRVFTDGVLTYGPSGTPPTSPGNFSVSSSTFSLLGKQTNGTNSANSNFDDLVILPWAAPAELVAAVASSSLAFGALPGMLLTGDIVQETSGILVTGAEVSSAAVQAFIDGAWASNHRVVSFKLLEVQG